MSETLSIGVATLAGDLALPEQARKVLAHLERHGDITRLKADKVYGIVNLPDCIYRLRAAGHKVLTERPLDDSGVRYVRYVIED
jgi:Helix-turn-helix domain